MTELPHRYRESLVMDIKIKLDNVSDKVDSLNDEVLYLEYIIKKDNELFSAAQTSLRESFLSCSKMYLI